MKQTVLLWFLIALLVASQAFMWLTFKNLDEKIEQVRKVDTHATTDDYLLIGNSIMANHDWGKALNKSNIYNSAVSGLTLFEANQFPSTFINRRSKRIFVELGINDLNTKVPTKMVVYAGVGFLGLVKKISPRSEVFVLSVLPINEAMQKGKATNAEIAQYNAKIWSWAKNNHIQYIDAFPALVDDKNQLNPAFTTDGLHLNEAGYERLTKVLEPYF